MNFIADMVIREDSTLVKITSSLTQMMRNDDQPTMQIVSTKNSCDFSLCLFYYRQRTRTSSEQSSTYP